MKLRISRENDLRQNLTTLFPKNHNLRHIINHIPHFKSNWLVISVDLQIYIKILHIKAHHHLFYFPKKKLFHNFLFKYFMQKNIHVSRKILYCVLKSYLMKPDVVDAEKQTINQQNIQTKMLILEGKNRKIKLLKHTTWTLSDL